MKKPLITLIIILASIALTAGIVKAASTHNITSKLGGVSGDSFDLDGTLMVDSLKVGSQGTGGVTFFNGTIINNTTGTGNSDNPVTFGDNVRIDGYVYRGPTAGTGDSKPFTVNDNVQINGTLTVGSTNIINAINSISDHDTLGTLSCTSGQIPKRGTSGWECGADIDTDTLGSLSCSSGQIAKRGSTGWECGSDTDTFAELDCNFDESPRFNGSYWTCDKLIHFGGDSKISGELTWDLPHDEDAIDLNQQSGVYDENYLVLDQVKTLFSSPSGSCSSYQHLGRIIVDAYADKLWVCMSGGWKSFTVD